MVRMKSIYYIYTLGVEDYQKNCSLGCLKGTVLYFTMEKYSLWTSRVSIYVYIPSTSALASRTLTRLPPTFTKKPRLRLPLGRWWAAGLGLDAGLVPGTGEKAWPHLF